MATYKKLTLTATRMKQHCYGTDKINKITGLSCEVIEEL